MRFLGCLETPGDVHVHCIFDGELRARRIVLSSFAQIRGIIVAKEVAIYGSVEDSFIFADAIILGSTCNVYGELYYKSLDIESGSYFEGRSRRSENPEQLAPAFAST